MADNDSRNYRSRDPLARNRVNQTGRPEIDDPLAELARLIGQTDPVSDYGREARGGQAYALDDAPRNGGDEWPADDRYADEPQYADDRAPRIAAPYPSAPALSPRDDGYEPPLARARDFRDDPHDYTPSAEPAYRDEQDPSYARQLPAFPQRPRDRRYADDQEDGGAEHQTYDMEDYDDDAPSPRRRGGFAIVAAVLGLAVLGTAGAFAYRAMFGGSMLPSLPPIIRASDGPNKIMPNYGDDKSATPGQADAANTGSGEKIVSREEKPVAVPDPKTIPRVVSTIPISPGTGSAPSGAPAMGAPSPGFPSPGTAPGAGAQNIPAVPAQLPVPATGAATPEPKKIHTVIIKSDQTSAPADMGATPPPAAAPVQRSVAPRPVAAPTPRAPAPQAGNGPLEIVPAQGDAPPSAHMRTAVARPAPAASPAPSAPAATAGGSYSVQVSSQRSEADAQSSFRALSAKYPNQLGGREPMVRRADLGDKGIYYRALVGPFASMEQAAGMCSSLKAAGGSCIVQKN